MRYHDQDLINPRPVNKICNVEAMESRTLLSGAAMWHEGFHEFAAPAGNIPAHVVSPFGQGGKHGGGEFAGHWQPQDNATDSSSQTTEVAITDDGLEITILVPDGSLSSHHGDGKSLRSVPDAPNFGDFGIIVRDERTAV